MEEQEINVANCTRIVDCINIVSREISPEEGFIETIHLFLTDDMTEKAIEVIQYYPSEKLRRLNFVTGHKYRINIQVVE